MKICFITNSFSLNGGVGTYVYRLSRNLARDGHLISIIHADPRCVSSAGENPELFYFPHFDDFAAKPENARSADAVMDALRKIRPDIVHIQSNNNFVLEERVCLEFPALKSMHVYDFCPAGTKYHQAFEKPCVHKTGPMCLPRMLYKRCAEDKNPATLWMFYRRAKAMIENDKRHLVILTASEYVREQTLQNGYRPEQVRVLPYFTLLGEHPKSPDTLKDPKIILASGRMVPEKGLDRLLYAVSYIKHEPDWKLVLDGAGSDEPRLRKLVEKLDLRDRVDFAGWLPPEKHWEIFENSYMAAVPSVWPEPFGLVGIEAMSYAKPVVAFRTGGIPDWLEDGKTGHLVTPYDTREMSEKILHLLQKPELASRMGEAGRKRAELLYSPHKHIQNLLQIYRQTAGLKEI